MAPLQQLFERCPGFTSILTPQHLLCSLILPSLMVVQRSLA